MNDNNTTTEDTVFQEALDSMPEEVRDYMWSPAFDYEIEVAQKVLGLSDQEKAYVKDISYDLLMRLVTMESASEKLLNLGIAPEKVSKIMYFIYQEILQSAQNLINYYGDVQKAPQETTSDAAGSIDQSANISNAFIPRSVLTPVKRDYSPQKTTSPDFKHIDPYRELPEK